MSGRVTHPHSLTILIQTEFGLAGGLVFLAGCCVLSGLLLRVPGGADLWGRCLLLTPLFACLFVIMVSFDHWNVYDFAYKCSDFYAPEVELGVAWDDREIGIDWPDRRGRSLEQGRRLPRLRGISLENLPRVNDYQLGSMPNPQRHAISSRMPRKCTEGVQEC